METIIGYIGAFCTTISFLPQIIKVIQTRDTQSLSLSMYAVFTIGVCFWLAYGILKQDGVIMLANSVTLLLTLPILLIKIRNDFYLKK